MKRTLKAFTCFFYMIDAAAMLFSLSLALTASARDGEIVYVMVFLLFTLAFVSVGCGALPFRAKRGSVLGLWCPVPFLGIPPVVVAGHTDQQLPLAHQR
jgi:hypothetical protein